MSNSPSIALGCNFFNDAAALRGLLETSARYFDQLFLINAGPNGDFSTDGSVELAESFGARVLFDDMNKGFGHVRSRLIHECGCEWCFILDADERFFPELPVLHCEGVDRYPNPPNPNLSVFIRPEMCRQGAALKEIISDPSFMTVRSNRRHWFDFGMKKAAENWIIIKDHQMRIVRNRPEIGYEPNRKMHERLVDLRTNQAPKYFAQDDYAGPHIDHFHLFFRRTQPGKKEANEANYGRLDRGELMVNPT